jgi:hypothetical protein
VTAITKMRSRCDGDHKNALLPSDWRRHGRIALKAGIRLAKIIDENLGVAARGKNVAIRWSHGFAVLNPPTLAHIDSA